MSSKQFAVFIGTILIAMTGLIVSLSILLTPVAKNISEANQYLMIISDETTMLNWQIRDYLIEEGIY